MGIDDILTIAYQYSRRKVASPTYARNLNYGASVNDEIVTIDYLLQYHMFRMALVMAKRYGDESEYFNMTEYIQVLLKELSPHCHNMDDVDISKQQFILNLSNTEIYIQVSDRILVGISKDVIQTDIDPILLAKLIIKLDSFEIPDSVYEGILSESQNLCKQEEILLLAAKKQIEDLYDPNNILVSLELARHEKLKVSMYDTSSIIKRFAVFYTTIFKIREDVQQKISDYRRITDRLHNGVYFVKRR